MKQLEQQIFQPEPITVANQKEVNKEIKLLGSLKMQRGQSLWKLNLKTKMIYQVKPEDATLTMKGGVRKKVVLEDDCIYAVAINVKNAERKFIKMIQK